MDRNLDVVAVVLYLSVSLSARRAWIEIFMLRRLLRGGRRRSPQGERG